MAKPVVMQNPPERFLYTPTVAGADAVWVGLVYPASYQIAMSSLGYLTLFQLMDQNPRISPTRIYADSWTGLSAQAYELLGYSLSFELDMVQILESFQALDIPQYAKDRSRDCPLVFAGGPVPMSNPEPYADFFDFFIIGEGEEILDELAQALQTYRHLSSREELLHRLAVEVAGVYVPSMYHIEYAGSDGPIQSITPRYHDVPPVVQKRFIENMEHFVASTPIVTEKAFFSNMFLVEVVRGCAHRCRFCLASYATLPVRSATIDRVIARIEAGIQYTDKVGLLGLLIADHPQFPELCEYLNTKEGLTISAASLRADTLTLPIAQTFKKGQQKQVTIAVESGSEKLRRRINKNLKHEAIMRAASVVAESGLEGLKIYGMVGLPDEDESDVAELAQLMKALKKENPRLKLHLGCSSFVPKAGTPFQWQPRLDNKQIDARFQQLQKALYKTADFRPQSAKWDYFQALLSRGDRRLAPLIVRFWEFGGTLGALNRAYKALKAEGKANFPELDWYALRERPEDEILPWDMLSLGVSKAILYKEGLPPPGFVEAYANAH